MIIGDIELTHAEGKVRLSASVVPETAGRERQQVWFEFPEECSDMICLSGDPFLAGFMFTCMHDGERLRIDAPVSPKLLKSTATLQRIFSTWFPGFMSRTEVVAQEAEPQLPLVIPRGVMSCFSGGVDSWYTYLANKDQVSHLLLVGGFDIKLRQEKLWERSLQVAREAASREGRTLVPVRTNLRELTDRFDLGVPRHSPITFWADVLIGSALSTMALCLQGGIGKLLIPSSYYVTELHPTGTHPIIDPLFSTEQLEVVHDACAVTRMDKLALVAHSATALEGLRVCFLQKQERLNCCKCEKCMRTMLALKVLGVLDQAKAFHLPLDMEQVITFDKPDSVHASWYEEILEEAQKRNDAEVVEALNILMGRQFSSVRLNHRVRTRLVRLGRRFIRRSILERIAPK